MAESSWIQAAVPVVQAFGPVVSWVIVLVGWVVVSRDGDRRERRKEVRLMVTSAITLVHAIEKKAHDYYKTGHPDGRWLGMEIKRELKLLGKMLNGLKRESPGLNFDEQIQELRQRVTGQDFDSAGRVAREYSNGIYLEISEAALDLVSALEERFGDIYSPVK